MPVLSGLFAFILSAFDKTYNNPLYCPKTMADVARSPLMAEILDFYDIELDEGEEFLLMLWNDDVHSFQQVNSQIFRLLGTTSNSLGNFANIVDKYVCAWMSA